MIFAAVVSIFCASLVDVVIKEFYVKKHLGDKYGHWNLIPNFWKDKIPNDKWYRIRYAMVLNAVFMIAAGFMAKTWWGSVIYLYLACINWEHILYQWIAGFFLKEKKYFDLHNTPTWMEGLPWNKAFARYHGESAITAEEIYTVAILGTGLLYLINLTGVIQ
jgi:hypothetical protein